MSSRRKTAVAKKPGLPDANLKNGGGQIMRDLVDEVLLENKELRKEKADAVRAVGSLSLDNAELRACLEQALRNYVKLGLKPCKMTERWKCAISTRLVKQ